MSISRRGLLSLCAIAAGSRLLSRTLWSAEEPVGRELPFLRNGGGPYRGIAKTLTGDDLVKARLTPESWQVEIIGAPALLKRPRKFDDGTALDYATLLELGKTHGIKFLKAMQCRNNRCPQNHAVWEGVPLREVLRLLGDLGNVLRVNYSGYHDPTNPLSHLHAISASFSQIMENGPGEPPIFLAYRHNGVEIPQARGGPVRVIVPWGYGFKSVKSLQRIELTSDTKPLNTYGGDPDSYVKTMAWPEGTTTFEAGRPIVVRGAVVCGLSGLKHVEYWLRPDTGMEGILPAGDPAWKSAEWMPCRIDPPPSNWKRVLPAGVDAKELWGFDPQTGKPKEWPLRYSLATWSATVPELKPGKYELRARAVDLNGFAQPNPRPQQATGKNAIQCKIITVTA